MSKETRIRISRDGAIRLPEELLNQLEWAAGHYLEIAVEDGAVRLEKVDVDPFEEAMKKPDPSEFDRILGEQKKSQEDAFKAFEENIKKPPEVLPEDREDHWR